MTNGENSSLSLRVHYHLVLCTTLRLTVVHRKHGPFVRTQNSAFTPFQSAMLYFLLDLISFITHCNILFPSINTNSECRCPVSNTAYSYSEVLGFISQSRDQVYLNILVGFLSHSMQIPLQYVKSGNKRFLPFLIQFIIL
jgi:hypothetical protein